MLKFKQSTSIYDWVGGGDDLYKGAVCLTFYMENSLGMQDHQTCVKFMWHV